MAELKKLTVQELRDLARKALGRGHSKLKTKAELIRALQAAEKKVAVAAEKAARKVKTVAARAAKPVAPKATRPAKAKGSAQPASKAGKAAREAAQAMREAAGALREAAGAAREGARRVRAAVRGEPEPDPESYMVARVAGEEAVRGAPHPMTESAIEAARPREARAEVAEPVPAGGYEEQLGDLPWSYADDALMALPRDPTTLFLYWDHAPETVRTAWQGLVDARPQLWVYAREADGRWSRVRTVDFALESRSYYVHDLRPGHVYRAEIHLVDRDGRTRLLPRGSNEMMLPPVGPSPIVDDRFRRILWSEPLQRLLREVRAGGPFPEDVRAQLMRLSDWSRFAGSSGGASAAAALGSSAGGMGGRPTSPWVRPSSSSPSSPWGRPDGEGR
jgi:hypothetical protein